MLDVVTAGETMVLGVPSQPGRLRHASALELKIGGAESNVAIALSRLGLSAGWASYLGTDELGQLVLDRIRGEGVDTSRVRRMPDAQTGLYLREYVGQRPTVYYYRHGSAASCMARQAFEVEYFAGGQYLHLTGVTPALSKSCHDFTLWAAQEAHGRDVRVSFDVNYRSKLWSTGKARRFVEEILPAVDLLFVSEEESMALWSRADENFLAELAKMGPREVILKRGNQGSAALVEGKLVSQPAFDVQEVDAIGAGDAFAAGYLAGSLWQVDSKERLRLANAMGACSVQTLGDYEGLPGVEELEGFLSGGNELGR